jgi:hypothetical protein
MKVLCIKDLPMFLNEEFVEVNKYKLQGRKVEEHFYLHYQEGKLYECSKFIDGQTYVDSDLTFPENHPTYRMFNETRPKRPKPVQLWQCFFDTDIHENKQTRGSEQDFNKYFKII